MSRLLAICLQSSLKTWADHRTNAQNDGGELLRIDSLETQQFLDDKFTDQGDYIWVGANDIDTEGEWVWTDGQGGTFWEGDENGKSKTCAFTNWRSSNPQGGTAQKCGAVDWKSDTDSFVWYDRYCTDTEVAFYQFDISKYDVINAKADYTCHKHTTVVAGTRSVMCVTVAEKSWTDHKTAAGAASPAGKLAKIDSQELQTIASTKPLDQGVWIGLNDIDTEGDFYWTGDETSSTNLVWKGTQSGSSPNGAFTQWSSSQPNQNGDQDCVYIKTNGNWIDSTCASTDYALYQFDGAQCSDVVNNAAYSHCVEYTPLDPGTAGSDTYSATLGGGDVTGNLLNNDANGAHLKVTSVIVDGTASNPGTDIVVTNVGTLNVAEAGSFTFTPLATFVGQFTFSYVIAQSRLRRRLQTTGTVTITISSSAGANGDPHFLRWGQTQHDTFHGECDLVLASSKKNKIDIHLRTRRRRFYSFIKKIGMRIGNNMIEIGKNYYTINGVTRAHDSNIVTYPLAVPALPGSDNEMANTYSLMVDRISKKKKQYKFSWTNSSSAVLVSITGSYLNVELSGGPDFADSVGMMGEFGSGKMLDRQGKSMNPRDMNAYGMEWQVKHALGDAHVFSEAEGPQWPAQQCLMPESSMEEWRRRNFRANKGHLLGVARLACAGVVSFDKCLDDVTASGEIESAEAFRRQLK